jgi:hypothetical protein
MNIGIKGLGLKPRAGLRLVWLGACLPLLPACMQLSGPGNTPPTPAADPAQMRFVNPVLSPYGKVQEMPRVPVRKRPPHIEPLPDPEPDENDSEPVDRRERPQEPEIETAPIRGQRVGTSEKVSIPEQPRPMPNVFAEEPPLLQAMRSYMDKRPDQAVELLQRYPAENQDALLVLLPLTVRMTEDSLRAANPQELGAMIDQLQQLMQTLQPKAALVMDKICFCRQIRSFGKYEPLTEHPAFHVGEMVELYAEIRNLSCEKTSSRLGGYRTSLTSRLEIRDVPGAYFWKPQTREKIEYSLTPQHDYFHHYRFALPEMPPGEYTLLVEIADVPTGRKVKRNLDFRVNP